MLGDVDLEELARTLTAERIAAEGPWSASTVRYRFGEGADGDGGRFAFRRRDLVRAVVELALDQAVEQSTEARDEYHRRAGAMRADRTTEGVLEALEANLERFVPGASADVDAAPRERVYYLALAVADTDTDVARLLQGARARQLAAYVPMYEAFLDVTGRELNPGTTITDLAHAIYALLDGHLMRMRYEPTLGSEGISQAVLALFTGLTRPRGEEPRSADERLWPQGAD